MSLNDSKMPDTPWHVGFTKKKENDPRRHKSRCIHYRDGYCLCGVSASYYINCHGSAHCKYYAENQSTWNSYVEDMKTSEDKKQELINQRVSNNRKVKQLKAKKAMANPSILNDRAIGISMKYCPICVEKMNSCYCQYCGFDIMEYIEKVKELNLLM